MTKKPGRPKNPNGEGTQVRIDTDLIAKARYLVAVRGDGTSLTQLLSGILRPTLEREFTKATKQLIEGEKTPKR